MKNRFGLLLAQGALLLALVSAAAAHDEPVATGLTLPRQLSYGADGTLYIAEAGLAGSDDAEGPLGPVKVGNSAQVSAVDAEGSQSVLISGLISTDTGFGNIAGATAVLATEDSIWVTLGEGPVSVAEGSYVSALVQYDKATLEVKQVVDLGAFELANNPDGAPETVSNPTDFAVTADGTVLIADASANALLSWTEADGLQVVAAWPTADGDTSAVPTSVAIGPDGDVYVGFLSGFPFPAEGARIERWSAGELKQTYEGLTMVTDVLVTEDGSLYAVQFASSFGDQGWVPESGSVVKVTEEGLETLEDGLNFPYGIALSPEGELMVTVSSYGAQEMGTGSVIAVHLDE